MNQILYDLKHGNNFSTNQFFDKNDDFVDEALLIKKRFFKYAFVASVVFLLLFFGFYVYHFLSLKNNQRISDNLSYNYHTLKLYSSPNSDDYNDLYGSNFYEDNFIIGEIVIPSLDISYPIFSRLDDDTLKVAPCIFYGKMPPESGNLCIAGHNYNNEQFFSLIHNLSNGDFIYIYDMNNKEYVYSVFSNYEVKIDDLSPIYFSDYQNELTLITCNNVNDNRIIVKAHMQ